MNSATRSRLLRILRFVYTLITILSISSFAQAQTYIGIESVQIADYSENAVILADRDSFEDNNFNIPDYNFSFSGETAATGIHSTTGENEWIHGGSGDNVYWQMHCSVVIDTTPTIPADDLQVTLQFRFDGNATDLLTNEWQDWASNWYSIDQREELSSDGKIHFSIQPRLVGSNHANQYYQFRWNISSSAETINRPANQVEMYPVLLRQVNPTPTATQTHTPTFTPTNTPTDTPTPTATPTPTGTTNPDTPTPTPTQPSVPTSTNTFTPLPDTPEVAYESSKIENPFWTDMVGFRDQGLLPDPGSTEWWGMIAHAQGLPYWNQDQERWRRFAFEDEINPVSDFVTNYASPTPEYLIGTGIASVTQNWATKYVHVENPTPASTPTPGFASPRPTATPGFATPRPTATEGFATPRPTATEGFATPRPTATEGFATPRPTSTPQSTATPLGFESPTPANTPSPAATPTPVATPTPHEAIAGESYTETIGDGVSTVIQVDHGLGIQDPGIILREHNSPFKEVPYEVARFIDYATFYFDQPPSVDEYDAILYVPGISGGVGGATQDTPTPASTPTPMSTPTPANTPTPNPEYNSPTPANTATPGFATPRPSATPASTSTPADTPTPGFATERPTSTPANTATPGFATERPTSTPINTPTPQTPATPRPSATPASTPTPANTPTPVPTDTPTNTPTVTSTPTPPSSLLTGGNDTETLYTFYHLLNQDVFAQVRNATSGELVPSEISFPADDKITISVNQPVDNQEYEVLVAKSSKTMVGGNVSDTTFSLANNLGGWPLVQWSQESKVAPIEVLRTDANNSEFRFDQPPGSFVVNYLVSDGTETIGDGVTTSYPITLSVDHYVMVQVYNATSTKLTPADIVFSTSNDFTVKFDQPPGVDEYIVTYHEIDPEDEQFDNRFIRLDGTNRLAMTGVHGNTNIKFLASKIYADVIDEGLGIDVTTLVSPSGRKRQVVKLEATATPPSTPTPEGYATPRPSPTEGFATPRPSPTEASTPTPADTPTPQPADTPRPTATPVEDQWLNESGDVADASSEFQFPDGRISGPVDFVHLKRLRFEPNTTGTEAELLNELENGDLVLWKPNGGPIARLTINADGTLYYQNLVAYDDREPNEDYLFAVETPEGSLYLTEIHYP